MQHYAELPPLPKVEVRVEEDRSEGARGFLWRRSRLIEISAHGASVGSLVYDEVDRACLDAVVVVPYFFAPAPDDGALVPWVVLRSAVRPPVTLRGDDRPPSDAAARAGFWELPAGLVEPAEASWTGIRRAASRELFEETGLEAAPDALEELGCPSYPVPGVIAERHYFFRARVRPEHSVEPALDGSPLEAAGELAAVPLEALLEAVRRGTLPDAKTELGLRRLDDELRRATT